MCVFLHYLKYSHLVGLDTQYLGLQRNMKMRDIAWVSGGNTFITENINTLITEQKDTFDHWSRKILGWRQDFLRWEQLWPFAPILKPSRISWNSTIIIFMIIVLVKITMIVIIINQSLNFKQSTSPFCFEPKAPFWQKEPKYPWIPNCLIVGCLIVWLPLWRMSNRLIVR